MDQNPTGAPQSGHLLLAQAINALTNILQSIMLQVGGTSSSASAGAATLPANPVGFVTVTLTDGTSVKVPYYT